MSLLSTIVSAEPDSRPNILVIMADDHAKRALSAYGQDLMATPHIDRLADEGVLFRNAFVTNAICSPSRAVLLTGKFSHLNGVFNNGQAFDGQQQSLPGLLRQAGYSTAVVGKWHLKSEPVAFDHWEVLIGQGEYYSPRFKTRDGIVEYPGAYATDKITDLAIDALAQRDTSKPFLLLYQHKAPHRNWMPPLEALDPEHIPQIPMPADFDDDYGGRRAAAASDMRVADMFLSFDMKMQPGGYLRETGTGGARGNPQGVAMALEAWRAAYDGLTDDQKLQWDAYYAVANAEFDAVKDDPDALARWKYQRYLNDYIATTRALDKNVGRMLTYLDDSGLTGNTIVIYTSDQGFFLGEHGWYDKRFMYEPAMQMPLLLRYPAAVAARQEVVELVQNLDFAPTLLEFAGVAVPDDMQGLSLAPLVVSSGDDEGLEESRQRGWRDSLYYHFYGEPNAWHRVRTHYGIRTERYKLIHFQADDGDSDWELYDLRDDSGELNNLYGKPGYGEIQENLHARLHALREQYRVPEDTP